MLRRLIGSKVALDPNTSDWGTTSFTCPRCKIVFSASDLQETLPLGCPSCGVRFTVEYKYHWLYLFACLLCSGLIAYLQGFRSIVFCGAVTIYFAIAAVALNLLGFTLKLPRRFVIIRPHTQTLDIDRHDDGEQRHDGGV